MATRKREERKKRSRSRHRRRDRRRRRAESEEEESVEEEESGDAKEAAGSGGATARAAKLMPRAAAEKAKSSSSSEEESSAEDSADKAGAPAASKDVRVLAEPASPPTSARKEDEKGGKAENYCSTCWRSVGGGRSGMATHERSAKHIAWLLVGEQPKMSWAEAMKTAEKRSQELWAESGYTYPEKTPRSQSRAAPRSKSAKGGKGKQGKQKARRSTTPDDPRDRRQERKDPPPGPDGSGPGERERLLTSLWERTLRAIQEY